MCGRFVSSNTPDKIASYFGATFDTEPLGDNFNVAPTNDVYAVVADSTAEPVVRAFHWGLVPSWAKDDQDRLQDDQRPRRDASPRSRRSRGCCARSG
jgi:putative SOS response-associated peptidase YedK